MKALMKLKSVFVSFIFVHIRDTTYIYFFKKCIAEEGVRRAICDMTSLISHLVLAGFTLAVVDIEVAAQVLKWNLKRCPNGISYSISHHSSHTNPIFFLSSPVLPLRCRPSSPPSFSTSTAIQYYSQTCLLNHKYLSPSTSLCFLLILFPFSEHVAHKTSLYLPKNSTPTTNDYSEPNDTSI